ncbi:membrane protein [Microbacterium sp. CH12i]|nr:membrane protein [Microbacterium sp. CH12i]
MDLARRVTAQAGIMTVETLPAQRSAQLLLLRAVAVYTVVGLAVGLFYREFTKANGYPEGLMGQLGLAHTHILTLGMIVLLIVLALEKVFVLSSSRLFRWFFWIYNAGVVLTGAMLIWHGMLQVQDLESSKMIAGIAGLGHMLVGAGFVLLLLSLRTAIRREPVRQEAARQDA